jgi:hypothetical protein
MKHRATRKITTAHTAAIFHTYCLLVLRIQAVLAQMLISKPLAPTHSNFPTSACISA